MSSVICLNQMLRRTIGSVCSSSQRANNVCKMAPTSSLSILSYSSSSNINQPSSSPNGTSTISIRNFAKAATKAKSNTASASYKERKAATKQLRTDRYHASQHRLSNIKTRRSNSPKDVLKTKFRSWYDKELIYHDTLLRTAKKLQRPWRTRVAVMVERIPVVTPDMDEWEIDYMNLRDYIWSYGKVYPEESGFMFDIDKEEDHDIPSDEELLAGLPFTPAPRETEADATGNIQTRDRQLKTSVFLGIKSDAEGNKSGPRWTLPSALAQPNETLLQTAQRAVQDVAGSDLKVWCPSNAPMTVNFRVYNKNLPEELRGDGDDDNNMNYYGEKIFYYRVQYDSGDVNEKVTKKANVDDWGWLANDEMVKRVTEERGEHQAKFFRYML